MVGDQGAGGVESRRRLFGNLAKLLDAHPHGEVRITHDGFWLLDMLVSEEELTVEITQVDRIKIDDINMVKTCHDKVLEQFASYTASTDEQHS